MAARNSRSGIWALTDAGPHTKRRYKFPYGDFKKAHRCGMLSAEFRAMEEARTTSSARRRSFADCLVR
jgi:hypothetical protein